MKTTSIGRLLEVGHFLYQLQSENNPSLFCEEIEQILDSVFESLEIVKRNGRFHYVVNTDEYEQVMVVLTDCARAGVTGWSIQLVLPSIHYLI